MTSRDILCANIVLETMPFAVGRLYVKSNFDEASKRDVIKLNNFFFSKQPDLENNKIWKYNKQSNVYD
jgi:hypothetical protein